MVKGPFDSHTVAVISTAGKGSAMEGSPCTTACSPIRIILPCDVPVEQRVFVIEYRPLLILTRLLLCLLYMNLANRHYLVETFGFVKVPHV